MILLFTVTLFFCILRHYIMEEIDYRKRVKEAETKWPRMSHTLVATHLLRSWKPSPERAK